MLVLSRKRGEQIKITGGIVLTVVEIGPGRVKIGIEAPPDVNIWRAELPVEAPKPPASRKASGSPRRKTK